MWKIRFGKPRNVLGVVLKRLITAQADFEQIRGKKKKKKGRGGEGCLQFCHCDGGTVGRHAWECPGHAAPGHSGTSRRERSSRCAGLPSPRAVCPVAEPPTPFGSYPIKVASQDAMADKANSHLGLNTAKKPTCMRIHSGYRRCFTRYNHVKREHYCVTNPKAITLLSLMFPLSG